MMSSPHSWMNINTTPIPSIRQSFASSAIISHFNWCMWQVASFSRVMKLKAISKIRIIWSDSMTSPLMRQPSSLCRHSNTKETESRMSMQVKCVPSQGLCRFLIKLPTSTVQLKKSPASKDSRNKQSRKIKSSISSSVRPMQVWKSHIRGKLCSSNIIYQINRDFWRSAIVFGCTIRKLRQLLQCKEDLIPSISSSFRTVIWPSGWICKT